MDPTSTSGLLGGFSPFSGSGLLGGTNPWNSMTNMGLKLAGMPTASPNAGLYNYGMQLAKQPTYGQPTYGQQNQLTPQEQQVVSDATSGDQVRAMTAEAQMQRMPPDSQQRIKNAIQKSGKPVGMQSLPQVGSPSGY